MAEIDQLVKMANQIADNFSFHDDAVERLTDHLQRFWAPSMRQELVKFHQSGGTGLKAPVVAAVRNLEHG